jgi:hypothetical protein
LGSRPQVIIADQQRHSAQFAAGTETREMIVEAEQLAIECTDQIGDSRAEDKPGVGDGYGERARDELAIAVGERRRHGVMMIVAPGGGAITSTARMKSTMPGLA